MRRTDREKDSDFAFEVLRDCEYASLATVNADNIPYCIPISIVVHKQKIYFHSAMSGLKLDSIAHNSHVCISGVRYTKLVPEKFTTEFESAVAQGICTLVQDEAEKILALRLISEKYASSNMEAFERTIRGSLSRTAVARIDVTQITGKANMQNK